MEACNLQPLPNEVEELLRNEEMAFQGQTSADA